MTTPRSSVSTLNGLLSLRDLSVLTGSKSWDLKMIYQISVHRTLREGGREAGMTYSRKGNVTISTLGGSGELLDGKVSELSS
jgi:hypothetical protein